MTTPLESIENTVTRLRVKVGPDGWHADQIARAQVELDDAVLARDMDAGSLAEWEKILDTLRADKAALEQMRKEFLRRHHLELVPHDGIRLYTEKATGGVIENPKVGSAWLANLGDYVIPGSWVEKTAGGYGVLKSDNPITKAEANGYDVHDFDKKEA